MKSGPGVEVFAKYKSHSLQNIPLPPQLGNAGIYLMLGFSSLVYNYTIQNNIQLTVQLRDLGMKSGPGDYPKNTKPRYSNYKQSDSRYYFVSSH